MSISRATKRSRENNRKEKDFFVSLPHAVLDSDAYISLSCKSVKLLIDLFRSYNGRNNGDPSCAFKLMKQRGCRSKSHLDSARIELIEKGLIVLTRQGGRNKCNLYAVTWKNIDECRGQLDTKETNAPLGYWKEYVITKPQLIERELKSVPQLQGTFIDICHIVMVKLGAKSSTD